MSGHRTIKEKRFRVKASKTTVWGKKHQKIGLDRGEILLYRGGGIFGVSSSFRRRVKKKTEV